MDAVAIPAVIRFDPLRRANSERAAKAVRALIALVEAHEALVRPRQRARKQASRDGFHAAIEALVCNLALLSLDPLNRPLAVSRANGANAGQGRYAEPVIGRHFVTALDLMADPALSLIEDIERGFSVKDGSSRPSIIRPGPAFSQHFPVGSANWYSFRRIPPAEPLVMKAPKLHGGEKIDYRDNAFTEYLRKQITAFNKYLNGAPFYILPQPGGFGLTANGLPFDPTRRSLRRIFNDSEWNRGGRLYGSFWETMPAEDRFRRIRICSAKHPWGEPPAAVDFPQFNPRGAYALDNLPPPAGDLYDIRGDGSCRAGFKELLNALLSTNKPMKRLPAEVQRLFPVGTKARDVIAEVAAFHAPIAGRFCTGIGLRLAEIESTILMRALFSLARQGVIALPVHDAVYVGRSEAPRAVVALSEAAAPYGEALRIQPTIDFGPDISST